MVPTTQIKRRLWPVIVSFGIVLLLLLIFVRLTINPVSASSGYQAAPTATMPAKTVGYITAAPALSLNTPSNIDSSLIKASVDGGPLVSQNTGLSGGMEEGIIGLSLAIVGLLLVGLCWLFWRKFQQHRKLHPVRQKLKTAPVYGVTQPTVNYSNKVYQGVSQSISNPIYPTDRPPSPDIDNVVPRQKPVSPGNEPVFNCPHCGKSLRVGSKFCGYCATPVSLS